MEWTRGGTRNDYVVTKGKDEPPTSPARQDSAVVSLFQDEEQPSTSSGTQSQASFGKVCLFEGMSGWMCLQGADWFQPKDGGGSYFQDKSTVPKAPAVLSPLATASRTSSRTQLMQPAERRGCFQNVMWILGKMRRPKQCHSPPPHVDPMIKADMTAKELHLVLRIKEVEPLDTIFSLHPKMGLIEEPCEHHLKDVGRNKVGEQGQERRAHEVPGSCRERALIEVRHHTKDPAIKAEVQSLS
ncbi:unnamed protein product [Pleuronectes platessa]|uniref:Uncharacterized protein n=1 Tax=Pleuronectes platessa TaxID=8262 RepID=A0A9N7VXN5_PLEPL|nr:unnamed protein product [Pleuronectes platessa]